MDWQQLLIQAAQKKSAEARYNLGFVPQIYVVTSTGMVVKKIDGFNESNEIAIINFLNRYLPTN
jgi:hypothetical protein